MKDQLKATFITPFGRFCPTRAPFGLASMPEIFTKKMDKLFNNVEGVFRSMDDFLIGGRSKEEHDKTIREVLQICKDNGIILNINK